MAEPPRRIPHLPGGSIAMMPPVGLPYDIIEVGRMMMFEYGNHISETSAPKLGVSLNFLARTLRQLHAITLLVSAEFVSDAWSLHRSLMERYLLYRHLTSTGEFDIFDDWCFRQQFEHLNKIKSNPEFVGKPEMKNRRFSSKDKLRYQRVSKDTRVKNWHRPDLATVARQLEMKFLYDVGFDAPSGYVHPVSTDGYEDYLLLMGRTPDERTEEMTVLRNNSCLVAVLHMQHFMNQPEYNWRKVLYDLVDCFAKTAGRQDCDYSDRLQKTRVFHQSGEGLLTQAKD